LIEIYVPEKSTLFTRNLDPKPDEERVTKPKRGGQVIDVTKPPIPFSLAELPNVQYF
jgi:hypothetical protein